MKGKYPEKTFFWSIIGTVRKELATELLSEVCEKRMQQANANEMSQANITMQVIWAEKLLEFPVEGLSSKANRRTNLF
jgi:hypothetical protein